jgi:predicted ArsR family transcriptional regulator
VVTRTASSTADSVPETGRDIGHDPAASGVLSPTTFTSAVSAITNAFGDPTRRQIYLFVHERADGVTAAQVAEHVHLHPNVARHHLDKLVAAGHVDVGPARSQGSAGRPSKLYRAAAKHVTLDVAVKSDDLVLTLLGRALALLPPEMAEQMAEEVGADYGRVLASGLGDVATGQRSLRSALHAVADALTAHGFAAHTEKKGNQLTIVNNHCPFGVAAIENPVICAVDRGMVKGMLSSLYGESNPEIAASLPQGDTICVTSV